MKGRQFNPLIKYLGPEDHLQHQAITWVKLQYPAVRFHHSPNEGKRSAFERFKYKYLGSDSGFPDLIFPSLLLAVELKIKPNRATPAQKEWLEYFESIGWRTAVCYTIYEFQQVVNNAIESNPGATLLNQ